MGITGLEGRDRYGLTLVLGGGEVQLVDMVNAYGTFANEGVRNDLSSIIRIEDADGNVIEEHETRARASTRRRSRTANFRCSF